MNGSNLVEALLRPEVTTDPAADVKKASPDLSIDDAYALQFELMRRRAQLGDEIVGYQASFTSAAAQRLIPDMPVPMVGTLLASTLVRSGGVATLDWDRYGTHFVESEIGMLLSADLAGPGVTPTVARGAVKGLFPAMEVAPVRPGTFDGQWSNEHLIATHNTDSNIVVGDYLMPPTIRLQAEGLVISVDGETKGSATGVEAMGDPFFVLAEMANLLGRYGQSLRAGHIVITGSCVAPQQITPENRAARLECTRIGSVDVRLAGRDR